MESLKRNTSESVKKVEKETTSSIELENPKPIQVHPHFTDYEENVVVGEQPRTGSRTLPAYTLDWISRPDSYFMPMTGLDFLIGVPEVLLLQTSDDTISSSNSKFLVKIPKGETLYLGMENSSSIQKAVFGSQRNFSMTFLDPTKQEAVSFFRKGAFTNIGNCFRQELIVLVAEKNFQIGRIIQENSISCVSFTVFDETNKTVFKIIGSRKSFCGNLPQDVHFSILDPIHRTGGVILHKLDNDYKDFLYHITFPSSNTNLHHKMLLIGTALLVEYTYFKKTGCFGFT